MDIDSRKLATASAIALLVAMIAVNAETTSEAACITAMGIGAMIFFGGLFIAPFMVMAMLLAYPFSKAARKNVRDLGAPAAFIFGVGPVACGLVLYFTGGC